MSNLIWLHEDALRHDHPVFDAGDEDVHACFIWDDNYLEQMDYGFKRLVFIYETLIELPVTLYRGDTVDCLSRLAEQHGGRLRVPATPNPVLQQTIARLSDRFEVEEIADIPFVDLDPEPDLKRFFRYWNRARKVALKPGSGVDRG